MTDENLREEAGKIILGIFGPQEINRDDRWGRLQDAIEGLARRVRDEAYAFGVKDAQNVEGN